MKNTKINQEAELILKELSVSSSLQTPTMKECLDFLDSYAFYEGKPLADLVHVVVCVRKRLSIHYKNNNQYNEALKNFETTLALIENHINFKSRAFIAPALSLLMQIHDSYKNRSEFEKAEQALFKALEIYEKAKDFEELAFFNHYTKAFGSDEEYLEFRGIKLYEEIDLETLCIFYPVTIYSCLGDIYKEQQQLTKAVNAYSTAANFFIPTDYYNENKSYREQNLYKLAMVYEEMGQIKDAVKVLLNIGNQARPKEILGAAYSLFKLNIKLDESERIWKYLCIRHAHQLFLCTDKMTREGYHGPIMWLVTYLNEYCDVEELKIRPYKEVEILESMLPLARKVIFKKVFDNAPIIDNLLVKLILAAKNFKKPELVKQALETRYLLRNEIQIGDTLSHDFATGINAFHLAKSYDEQNSEETKTVYLECLAWLKKSLQPDKRSTILAYSEVLIAYADFLSRNGVGPNKIFDFIEQGVSLLQKNQPGEERDAILKQGLDLLDRIGMDSTVYSRQNSENSKK